jgi:hypothetical protein
MCVKFIVIYKSPKIYCNLQVCKVACNLQVPNAYCKLQVRKVNGNLQAYKVYCKFYVSKANCNFVFTKFSVIFTCLKLIVIL